MCDSANDHLPAIVVSRAPRTVLSPADSELHCLLDQWNNTSFNYPSHKCIHQLFETQVRNSPDSIAVIGGETSLTYSQLNARAAAVAARLIAAGVSRGSYVGLYLERTTDLVVAMLGVLKSGGAYVPIDMKWPAARRVQVALTSGMTHWVTQRSLFETTRELQKEAPNLQQIVCVDGKEICDCDTSCHTSSADIKSDDVAYVIFTSGSTGQPKGVVVKHAPVVNVIDWVNRTFGVGRHDKLLFVTSVAFDLSVYDVFGVLAAGGCIRIASAEELQNPHVLLRILRNEGITFWDSAPAALQRLIPMFEASETRTESLRLVFLSGDWIPMSLPGIVKKSFPCATVVGLGGATEAAIWSNYHVVDKIDPSWNSIPYGRPIQNAKYYILDDRFAPCAVGSAGRLYIGGECLASGYLNNPELTAKKVYSRSFFLLLP